MAGRQLFIGANAVSHVVRRILDWLRGRQRNESRKASGPDADATYTLFEGMDWRVHEVSAEALEDLQLDPGLLPGAFRIRVARTRDTSDQAGGLVRKRYASRGYLVPGAKPDPNLFTLKVWLFTKIFRSCE